jgi:LPS-assembly lipoprotein
MRFIAVLLTLLTLSACGFTPMYGGGSSSGNNAIQEKLNAIDIANIPNQEGQSLRNQLIDRFYHKGRPANINYTLSFTPLIITKTDLDLTKNASATRSQYRLSTTITLTDRKTGTALLERGLYASASYDILASRFTTRVSEKNAEQNAIADLARQIEQQIVLYFRR